MTTDSSGWLHAIANLGVIEKQREQAKRIKNYWSLAAAWFVWDQIKDVGPSLCPAFIEKAMNDFTQCQDPDAEVERLKEKYPTFKTEIEAL